MSKATHSGPLFLTDGGLETTMMFHEGKDLPAFAAFHLLNDVEGRESLRAYFRQYLDLAASLQTPFILGCPTWRANPDWGASIGYDLEALQNMNALAVSELKNLRTEYASSLPQILVSGCVGPRGDGYQPSAIMNAREAEAYHGFQMRLFADSGVDLISAMTLNYVEEAIGIVRAAKQYDQRPVISFTVETNGCLATGESLQHAVERTDAETDGWVDYYMINCAHPVHFDHIFEDGGDWIHRVGGMRCNASQLSHEALNQSESLDAGDPHDLAARMGRLMPFLPGLKVLGGCCGTDCRHVRAIGQMLQSTRTDT